MVFFSYVDYNYLRRVLMCVLIIFDMYRDKNYGQLFLYLTLIICIFALKLSPQFTCVLTIGHLNCCLDIYSSGLERQENRKR